MRGQGGGEGGTRLTFRLASDDDDDGFPANPHHDKIPPWGEFVINGHGGILSSAYSHH